MTLADKLRARFRDEARRGRRAASAAAMNAGASLVTFDDRLAEAAAMRERSAWV